MKNVNGAKNARRIAILGLGTVGKGTYDILTKNREHILKTQGTDIEIVRILERSADKLVQKGVAPELFCASIDEIVGDADIEVVVETLGGADAPYKYITAALKAGKSVVTANKELLAKHRTELEALAAENGCGLFFEASCVGGVPIIRALNESIQGDRITELYGIINGTTNYILSKMSAEGCDFKTALGEAQALGYAEKDPASDIDGYDSAYKLSVLASLAFHADIPYADIYREGISGITSDDIANAHALGYEIKLLAVARSADGAFEARVHPVFVPEHHPLASVGGAYNAVYLKGDNVGELMFYGAGAGGGPTGSAVVSDIIKALTSDIRVRPAALVLRPREDFSSGYYVCITVQDRAGVFAQISAIFGQGDVSIKSAIQREGSAGKTSILFLTHSAKQSDFYKALEKIKRLDSVMEVNSVIRVL